MHGVLPDEYKMNERNFFSLCILTSIIRLLITTGRSGVKKLC